MDNIQNTVPNEEDKIKALSKECRKDFTITGLKLTGVCACFLIVEIIFALGVKLIEKNFNIEMPEYFIYIRTLLCMHIIGFGIAALVFHFKPKVKFPSKKIGFWNFVLCLCAAFGIGVPLAMVGNVINFIILFLTGGDVLTANASLDIGTRGVDSLLGKIIMILVVVITAPIFEEHIFRKFLIDSIGKWGAIVSALVSGLFFGLYHGNLSQFFFAAFIGFLFANVYIRTGRIRYSIFIHMAINGVNAVLMLLLSAIDIPRLTDLANEMTALSSDAEQIAFMNSLAPNDLMLFAVFGAYFMFVLVYLGFVFTSFVLFFVFFKKIFFYEKPFKTELPTKKTFGCAFINIGTVLFILICLLEFALYYLK